MILRELIRQIFERMPQVRGGAYRTGTRHASGRRTRLLVGVALCAVALVAFTGCLGGDTAPPMITLAGSGRIVVQTGGVFIDPGALVSDNDPTYRGTIKSTITLGNNTPTAIDPAEAGTYTITYIASPDAAGNAPVPITRTVIVADNVIDSNNNGFIDINNIEHLNNIRYNLLGDFYSEKADITQTRCLDAGDMTCEGYELMRDLDFADGASYANGVVNPDWRPNATDPDRATNPGWKPIGTINGSLSASFSGNGFAISNLYVRRSGQVGLFGASIGTIRRIGVVDANIYGGTGPDSVGGLVGSNSGTVTASYVTGDIHGGAGGDTIGGLVGDNAAGRITTSYATGIVDGEGGDDRVGGLVGNNSGGGRITATYATGNANGGEDDDSVGGLVGLNNTDNSVTASYATGVVDGEGGRDDNVGGLIGSNNGTDTASYGFGEAGGGSQTIGTTRSNDTPPLTNACALTQTNSSTTGNRWDTAQWDFGNATQHPVLRFGSALIPGQTNRGC